tara:strand:+ start:145 stop:1164 length:1020 start_codon:yes stop_codon:yes gene_type:complete
MKSSKILVTGGAGYIGSHTVVKLLEMNKSIIILDNFSNVDYGVINRIKKIKNGDLKVIKGDITNRNLVKKIFKDFNVENVIHFAGLKAVRESDFYPIKYYENNVMGSFILFEEMEKAGVKNIVFSSSASVYGEQIKKKYREDLIPSPINVYGKTKLIIEEMLADIQKASKAWKVMILRYFNPIGAHKSGLIGDSPSQYPNNLMPFLCQVAAGIRDELIIFGNDYPTSDGTCKRDYIHVEDLAKAHIYSLDYLIKQKSSNTILNLGTGKSYSVLEVLKAFEIATGIQIPYKFVERRSGDLSEYFADPSKAKRVLNWEATLDLNRMCEDSWKWQRTNPEGI